MPSQAIHSAFTGNYRCICNGTGEVGGNRDLDLTKGEDIGWSHARLPEQRK